ncbi:MAG: hypothetical protein HOB40_02455 [Candidatus Marinimicrobia bacterium]|jgi:hypothetical protein|nr:hypothetical protein [Candidatus Neomarinimicrobiota bacterium]MBT3502089.1 hypothetical protein [Candidatus Neomarinimicrobiota bacterium]MBT3840468.1 hypothetical protein [Candidatus Neomarinimicrobiota bacterium]MBT3999978.1 hypothetical protein [Candidatus Neomarinimicrobiota bacterium]MBT4283513.1 hypothetical protein [Candidatus Neomarinimicrobiota bacterium]
MGKKISILFDSYHLYHLPQFDPVIDLLSKDDRFKIYHSTASHNKPEEKDLCIKILNDKPGELILADTEEARAEKIKRLAPDVFICGWSRYKLNQFVPDNTLVGMIYHGIGVKPSYWRDNRARLDIRFVEGQYRLDQLRNHGIETDLALTGFTKLDPLFNQERTEFDLLKKKLGLDPEKKTILFAPTFYPSSIERFGLKLGEYTQGYNVILKPHMWTYFLDEFSQYKLKAQRKLVYKLAEKFSHIKLLGPEIYNITPYYKISDLLLTEASSTIYEMLALEKPVIVNRFYRLKLSHKLFRYRLFRKRLSKEMNQDIANFCFEMDRAKDLPMMIEKALNENHNLLDVVKEYQYKMLYKLDGKASERVRDAILNRLNLRT